VSRAAAEAIHADQISQHGGAHGLRDEGLLEPVLARPRMQWHYDKAVDLAHPAAAYCIGLAKNYALVDGNKRTAFRIVFAFLYANGLELDASEPEVVELMLDVASGTVDEANLAARVRHHTERR
jgi:death-on-curing protein